MVDVLISIAQYCIYIALPSYEECIGLAQQPKQSVIVISLFCECVCVNVYCSV